jgi:hypothetical protein
MQPKGAFLYFFINPEDLARVVKGELKSWDHSHILHLIFMIY